VDKEKAPFTFYREGYLDGYLGRDQENDSNTHYVQGYAEGRTDDGLGRIPRFLESEYDEAQLQPIAPSQVSFGFSPKLVRDNIPTIIENEGNSCTYTLLGADEYKIRLLEKMNEELTEFIEDPSAEEAADIYEVFLALLKAYEIPLIAMGTRYLEKRKERGAFDKKILLQSIGEPV
jgi:predicted house-cleaning noncanonical NTP pyrophosphatase (MazG superfamily)